MSYEMYSTRLGRKLPGYIISRPGPLSGGRQMRGQVLPYGMRYCLIIHICPDPCVQRAQRCLSEQWFFEGVDLLIQQSDSWVMDEARDDQFITLEQQSHVLGQMPPKNKKDRTVSSTYQHNDVCNNIVTTETSAIKRKHRQKVRRFIGIE